MRDPVLTDFFLSFDLLKKFLFIFYLPEINCLAMPMII